MNLRFPRGSVSADSQGLITLGVLPSEALRGYTLWDKVSLDLGQRIKKKTRELEDSHKWLPGNERMPEKGMETPLQAATRFIAAHEWQAVDTALAMLHDLMGIQLIFHTSTL